MWFEWIPVEDFLPNNNSWVIVSTEKSDKSFQAYYSDGFWYELDWSELVFVEEIFGKVTAWMEMPEKYNVS